MNVVLLAFSTLRSTEFSLILFCKLQLFSPVFCQFNSVYLIFQNFQSFLAHFWIQTTSDPSTVIVQIISPESDTSRTYLVLFWFAFLAFWLTTSLPSSRAARVVTSSHQVSSPRNSSP